MRSTLLFLLIFGFYRIEAQNYLEHTMSSSFELNKPYCIKFQYDYNNLLRFPKDSYSDFDYISIVLNSNTDLYALFVVKSSEKFPKRFSYSMTKNQAFAIEEYLINQKAVNRDQIKTAYLGSKYTNDTIISKNPIEVIFSKKTDFNFELFADSLKYQKFELKSSYNWLEFDENQQLSISSIEKLDILISSMKTDSCLILDIVQTEKFNDTTLKVKQESKKKAVIIALTNKNISIDRIKESSLFPNPNEFMVRLGKWEDNYININKINLYNEYIYLGIIDRKYVKWIEQY